MSFLIIYYHILNPHPWFYFLIIIIIIDREYFWSVCKQVSIVKEKVAAVRADMPATRQKLIHAGKVLKDDTTLASSGVAENDFIVCMLTKEVAAKVS